MFCEKIVKNITTWLQNYMANSNLKTLVLGVSGGADSALVAALCDRAGIKIHGVCLPSSFNKEEEFKRALNVMLHLTETHHIVEIEPLVQLTLDACLLKNNADLTLNQKIRRGNVYARQRMILLYDIAARYNGCVLSTDNMSEYELGFWTLHGDVGDIAPIQALYKTEAYNVMTYLANLYDQEGLNLKAIALRDCITATPTDGLGITNSDLDQFGVPSYSDVDRVLKNKEEFDDNSPIIARYKASQFKRKLPVMITRDEVIL